MSVKRVVNIAFWTDWKIEGFSAAERYFYLYLLTGPCSTQLGIYETSIRQMAFHLGYTEARVRALLEKGDLAAIEPLVPPTTYAYLKTHQEV